VGTGSNAALLVLKQVTKLMQVLLLLPEHHAPSQTGACLEKTYLEERRR
jgi:hypothetical protein